VIESVAGIAGWGDDNGTGLADAAATAAFLAAIAAVALIALSIWGVVTDPARGVV
jgi:hypothetical protein